MLQILTISLELYYKYLISNKVPNAELINLQNVLDLLITKNYANLGQISNKHLYDQNNMPLLQDYITESQLMNTNQLLQNPLLVKTLNLLQVQKQIPAVSETEPKAYKFTLFI